VANQNEDESTGRMSDDEFERRRPYPVQGGDCIEFYEEAKRAREAEKEIGRAHV